MGKENEVKSTGVLMSRQTLEKNEYVRKVTEAINAVAETPSGVTVFKFLMAECGFKSSSVVVNSLKELDVNSMIYNEALRTFYINFRRYLEPELLNKIEQEE